MNLCYIYWCWFKKGNTVYNDGPKKVWKHLLLQSFSVIIDCAWYLEGEYCTPRHQVVVVSFDVKGCDTPGHIVMGRGGNFHGASLIFKIDEGGHNNGKAKNSYPFKGIRTPYS